MRELRVLIVDDEPLARRRLKRLLRSDPEATVVGECGQADDAVSAIDRLNPDLVLLDIQMPDADGFTVIDQMDRSRDPAIVFVTAYDEYAVRAFDLHAVDYLLKPVQQPRLRETLRRVRERRGSAERVGEKLLEALRELRATTSYKDKLLVKVRDRVFFVAVGDIDWIEAAGNYVRIHARKSKYLLRETMAILERVLDPSKLQRIHRSTIVNLDRVVELRAWTRGDYQVLLQDGTELLLSRTYRDRVREQWGRAI